VAPRALSAVVIALGLAALVVLARRASLPPTLPPCPSSDAVVFVDTRTRVLLACEGGQVAHAYRVRLGSAGVGKAWIADRGVDRIELR
jgi:hypothetical protein